MGRSLVRVPDDCQAQAGTPVIPENAKQAARRDLKRYCGRTAGSRSEEDQSRGRLRIIENHSQCGGKEWKPAAGSSSTERILAPSRGARPSPAVAPPFACPVDDCNLWPWSEDVKHDCRPPRGTACQIGRARRGRRHRAAKADREGDRRADPGALPRTYALHEHRCLSRPPRRPGATRSWAGWPVHGRHALRLEGRAVGVFRKPERRADWPRTPARPGVALRPRS